MTDPAGPTRRPRARGTPAWDSTSLVVRRLSAAATSSPGSPPRGAPGSRSRCPSPADRGRRRSVVATTVLMLVLVLALVVVLGLVCRLGVGSCRVGHAGRRGVSDGGGRGGRGGGRHRRGAGGPGGAGGGAGPAPPGTPASAPGPTPGGARGEGP